MRKHRLARKATIGRGWRALCSAVPLFVIFATLFVIPPVATAQEAPSPTGATGAPAPAGMTGAAGPTGAAGATGAPQTPDPTTPPPASETPATGSTGATGAPVPVGQPTITSDKPDYGPGGTVVLTGTNWQGDTTVHINVNDSIG